MHDAFQRISKRENADMMAGIKKHMRSSKRAEGDSMERFINDYYAHDSAFSDYFKKSIHPVNQSLTHGVRDQVAGQLGQTIDDTGEDFTNAYTDTLLWRYAQSSKNQLKQVIADTPAGMDAADMMDERLAEWQDGTSAANPTRPQKESSNEVIRLTNALARNFFASAGVTKLVWSGGDCPMCAALDGTVVGIDEPFASDGEDMGSGMTQQGDSFHPPLHQGCNCEVNPE